MKIILIATYFICFFFNNNSLFADSSKEQCFENMQILEEAIKKYAIKHNLKSKQILPNHEDLIKENFLDNKKYLSCPSTNQNYITITKNNSCEVVCITHGPLSIKKITDNYKKEVKKLNEIKDYLSKKAKTSQSVNDKKTINLRIKGIINLIILLILIILVITYFVRKRLIKNYCEKNYYVYEENPVSLTGTSEAFDVLCKGDTNYFTNGMYKKRGDIEINIIEFTAVTGRGKHSTTEKFTLCQLYKAKTEFPVFFMRSENVLLDSVGSMLGGQDIDFEEDNRFSNTFVLQGNDESEIRRFFNSKVRDAFVKNHKSGYCYESKGTCFLLYIKGHAGLKQKEVMLNTALKIFSIISTTGFKSNSMLKDIARNPKYYGKE